MKPVPSIIFFCPTPDVVLRRDMFLFEVERIVRVCVGVSPVEHRHARYEIESMLARVSSAQPEVYLCGAVPPAFVFFLCTEVLPQTRFSLKKFHWLQMSPQPIELEGVKLSRYQYSFGIEVLSGQAFLQIPRPEGVR